jgi:hypothetical protein
MAFAALVFQGQRGIGDCPHLDPETIRALGGRLPAEAPATWTGEEALAKLRARFRGVDLAPRAGRLGGWMQGDRLVIHCLGKVFAIDPEGGLHSDCHQNPWLHVPLLSYALDGAGATPAGDWVRFSELAHAKAWVRFFAHRCEEPLFELAVEDADLLLDVLDLFATGRQIEGFSSDHTFVLHPLPKVPVLFGYQRPEDDIPAGFSVFFDRTAEDNVDPESLFRLGSGLAQMFRRIAGRHGYLP